MNFCGKPLKNFGNKSTLPGNELFSISEIKSIFENLSSFFSQLWTSTQYWGIMKAARVLGLSAARCHWDHTAAGAAAMPADCTDPCTQCVTSLTGPGCCPSFCSLSYMHHRVDELCEEKGLLYLNIFLCVLLLWHYNLFTIIKCHFSSIRPTLYSV